MYILSLLQIFRGYPTPEEERFRALEEFYQRYPVQILSSLPWLAAEVLGRDGLGALILLLQHHGGTRLQLRRRKNSLQEVSPFISASTQREILRVCTHLDSIEVPSAGGVFQCMRRVAVQEALKKGMPIHSVAREVGVTQRYLRNELKRVRS
jgi:hypothetical protein